MDMSTVDRATLPSHPRRRWLEVCAALVRRLLTGLVLVGASTAPGGCGRGHWERHWTRGSEGCSDPAAPAGADDALGRRPADEPGGGPR